jgi:choline dehydrogenase
VHGARQSAADAYLIPVQDRPNLEIVTQARVRRLTFSGSRCTGVEYTEAGQPRSAACSGEVVLTAGAIGSPHVLLLSGIGPAGQLRQAGVDVVLDLPGVGENLLDHPMSGSVYRAAQPVPFIASNPPGEAVGLIHAQEGAEEEGPDTQIVFVSSARDLRLPDTGYTIAFAAMSPHSRGSVRLASADPDAPPLVDPNYLGDERDVRSMLAGLDAARAIGHASALAAWRDTEIRPGPDVTTSDQAREYLSRTVIPHFHYAGTCRIGTDDLAVVGSDLRVRGITGLRVADASIMPFLISGRTRTRRFTGLRNASQHSSPADAVRTGEGPVFSELRAGTHVPARLGTEMDRSWRLPAVTRNGPEGAGLAEREGELATPAPPFPPSGPSCATPHPRWPANCAFARSRQDLPSFLDVASFIEVTLISDEKGVGECSLPLLS